MVNAMETARIAAKKAIESTYEGICTVVEHRKVQKANKSIGFEEVVTLENQPCRLSYKTITNAGENDVASSVFQIIQVFLNPEINIKAGSKLIITQNGITTEYKSSSEPAFYNTHQEIILELFKEWA